MRALAIVLLIGGCWRGSARPTEATPTHSASPRDVALEWVRALLAGDAERAEQLSTIPFSFDRQRIDTLDELRTKLAAAAAKASRRPHVIGSAKVVDRGDLASHFAIPVAGHVGVS